jgi:outer membrane lipoprotein-sorting protein
MLNKILVSSFLGLSLLIFCSYGFKYFNFQKLSARMTTKAAQKGTTTTVKADVYYHSSGKMITHFFYPVEMFMINNAKGEVSIYDPAKNTAKQQQHYAFSTETSQLYYFLQNKKSDLGMKALGFTVNSTRFEEDLMITKWLPPSALMNQIQEVELVHRGANPIYMKYVGKDGKNAKKVYYYNYTNLNGIDFPLAITQIDFTSAKDSVITKTSYSDIRINESASHAYFDYSIPPTAKIIH